METSLLPQCFLQICCSAKSNSASPKIEWIYSVTNETPANVFWKDPNSAKQTEEGAMHLEIKESFKKQVK